MCLPRVDNLDAGGLERSDITCGDGEAASDRDGGDIAVWRGEPFAGGPGRHGQLGIAPGRVYIERQDALPEQL
ncbi:MAG: hypothetical protein LGR52_01810 [Candidatus Thiosymbion ectosymbiont of Robbea hypermnestra]|nr:hypothetical protein [Candidatus Thiosymbion ectosymbiont of Robbea hypermnestra]